MSMMPALIVSSLYLLAGICAYAGLLHAVAGLRRPRDWTQLLYAALCGLIVPFALTLAASLQATTPAAMGTLLKVNLNFGLTFFALFPWFIAGYARRGAPLVLGLLSLLGLLALAANLAAPQGFQFAEVTGLGALRLPWGEVIHLGEGPRNPWNLLGVLLVGGALGFSLWALAMAWYQTRRRAHLAMLLAVLLFAVTIAEGILVRLGAIEFAPLGFLGFIVVVLVMGLILSADYRDKVIAADRLQQRARRARVHYRASLERAARQAAAEREEARSAAVADGEAHLLRLLGRLHTGIVVHALDTRILFANAMAGELLGLTEAQMLGKTVIDPAWCFVDQDGASMPLADYPVNQVIATGRPLINQVLGVRVPERPGPRWLLVSAFPDWDSAGRLRQVVVNFYDITERRQAEVRIWRQANFDGLTGLPNRARVRALLADALANCREHLAVMFVDLDRFKEVNDTLGHEIGDALLQEVAQRMGDCVPPTAIIGRLGGDEFIIILDGVTDQDGPAGVAGQVLDRLAAPYRVDGDLAYISASIGITLFPDDGGDVTTLLKNADQAMYAAKREGRNRFQCYTPRMQEAADRRLRLGNDLHEALGAGQFVLHYQPIVALATGAVVKAEALVRWQHPTRGLVPPGEFIPLAEETGLIVGLGEWVFARAALQVRVWRERYAPAFQVSINESPMQFRAGLGGRTPWQEHLTRIGLAGTAVVIEITESVLMEAREEVIAQLQAWRAQSMQIALDDFGTGYSSLSYLKDFDIDYIKIDRSFVSNLSAGSQDHALCEAMIIMAHALGLAVVAEGVETPEQRRLLQNLGCDYGQGFLWSPPLPPADFERLLAGG